MQTTMKRTRGFTLIELMIAVAILAIVMGIAIPSYTQYVINSGRADGKAELFRIAQVLERCYTRYNSYTADECAIADGETIESEKGKYQVTVESTAATFTLTAAPQGGQTKDEECESFTLTLTGLRGLDGDPDGDVADCW